MREREVECASASSGVSVSVSVQSTDHAHVPCQYVRKGVMCVCVLKKDLMKC